MKKVLLQVLRVVHFIAWFPLVLLGDFLVKHLRREERE